MDYVDINLLPWRINKRRKQYRYLQIMALICLTVSVSISYWLYFLAEQKLSRQQAAIAELRTKIHMLSEKEQTASESHWQSYLALLTAGWQSRQQAIILASNLAQMDQPQVEFHQITLSGGLVTAQGEALNREAVYDLLNQLEEQNDWQASRVIKLEESDPPKFVEFSFETQYKR